MRKILNYTMTDYALRMKFLRYPEYQKYRMRLEVAEDVGCSDEIRLKVRNGPFGARFSARFGNGDLLVKGRWTIGKLLWTLISIFQTLFAAFMVLGFCLSIIDPYMNLNALDFIIPLVAVVLAVAIWCIYRHVYIIKPEKIVLDYFYQVILRERPLETIQAFDTSGQMVEYDAGKGTANEEDFELYENEKYVQEVVPRPAMTTVTRVNMLQGIGYLFALVVIWMSVLFIDSSSVKLWVILGIFPLSAGLIRVAAYLVQKREANKIAADATPYEATIIAIRSLNDNKQYQKIFEFTDENGGLHKVGSWKKYWRNRHENVEGTIGTKMRIWYAPNWHIEVLEGAERPVIKINMNTKPGRQTVALLLVGCICLGVGVEKQYERGAIDPVGQALQVSWADEYEETGLTQEDIEGDTVQWMCSTYALRAESDGGELYTIGVFEPTEENREYVRTYLDETWGITDRESAIDVFDSLLERGHRAKYQRFLNTMEKDGWLECSEEELLERLDEVEGEAYRYEGAYRAYHAFGEHGIDAWDYCRVIRVAGNCYVAGYITLEECMDQCLPIAKQLQEEFDSWEEVNQSYIYGYMYWIESEDDGYWTVRYWEYKADNLADIEDGPYSIDFDTELVDTWN